MGGAAGDGEADEPAPHLRRIFAGFTYKHGNWIASLGRGAAAAAGAADGARSDADDPVLLRGEPLADADDGADAMATSM